MLRRLICAVPTLAATSFVIFAILHASPADPCVGDGPTTPEQRAAICAQLGADVSLIDGYGAWARQFFVNEALHWLTSGDVT